MKKTGRLGIFALSAAVSLAGSSVAGSAVADELPADMPVEATEAAVPVRLAVLILRAPDSGVDAEVADSITELFISVLAASGRYHVVGKEEVKTLLGFTDELRALECIASPPCLGALATHLRVQKALVGSVDYSEGEYLLSLSLVNLVTGETENNRLVKVKGSTETLSIRVTEIALEAATPRPAPGVVNVTANVAGATVLVDDVAIGTAPTSKGGLEPGSHTVKVVKPGYLDWKASVLITAGAILEVEATLEVNPDYVAFKSRPSLRVATIGVFAFAVAGGATATAFGSLALENRNRAESPDITQRDAFANADRAERFALFANIGFGVAGAAVITSVIMAVVFSDHVFGPGKKMKSKGKPKAALSPLPSGGALGTLTLAW